MKKAINSLCCLGLFLDGVSAHMSALEHNEPMVILFLALGFVISFVVVYNTKEDLWH